MNHALFCLALLAVPSAAGRAEVVIDTDATLNRRIEESVRIIDGARPPTTVEIVAPADVCCSVRAQDSSIVSLHGGIVRR